MPSKKKSRPSFDIPEDLHTTPQAGWVYRTDRPDSRAKEKKGAHAASSGSSGTAARREHQAAPAKKKHPASSASKTKKSSEASSGILDLTVKTMSSGFSTAGDVMLFGARLVTTPFVWGMRIMGWVSRD